MKNIMFVFAAAAVFVFISGCCCRRDAVPVFDVSAYVAIADGAIAAADTEKEYDWQVYPAYVAAAENNDEIKLAAIVDSEGVMIWHFAQTEEDFARLQDYAKEIRNDFLSVKDTVDLQGNGSGEVRFCAGNNTFRTYIFSKIDCASRIVSGDAVGDQYLVLMPVLAAAE